MLYVFNYKEENVCIGKFFVVVNMICIWMCDFIYIMIM